MGLPRSKYVQEGIEGVYHCFSRCVRRAFLCGYDTATNRDFSHRKAWLVDRLRHLAGIFAIDVCAYAVMDNHYHTILRTRPDIVADWSDQEVATRWLALFPRHGGIKGSAGQAAEKQIRALASCHERIAELRRRLCSLSWFMGRLNEYIARAVNKEEKVKGRFWESRFKCQALLDDAAVAACMVYVDLNPIRARLSGSLEESDFTSIQQRIREYCSHTTRPNSASDDHTQNMQASFHPSNNCTPGNTNEKADSLPKRFSSINDSPGGATGCTWWLCPIATEIHRRGILPMTAAEYFDLVDKSGKLIRSDKRGAIDATLAPILLRIGANPKAWPETISLFGRKFRLAAGLISNLRNFAHQLGQRWVTGVPTARTAFAASPLQSA